MLRKVAAFVVPAFIVGFAIFYVVPFLQGLVGRVQSPTLQRWLSNKWINIGVIGLFALVGISMFTAVARAIKLPGGR